METKVMTDHTELRRYLVDVDTIATHQLFIDCLVIGAGIAGLTTGCYAQMNGYRSQIFEMDTLPGGVCTAWKRKGYTFDGCIHHLAGSKPSSKLYRVWQELGAMPRPMLYPEELVSVKAPDGQRVTLYYDPDRLEDHPRDTICQRQR